MEEQEIEVDVDAKDAEKPKSAAKAQSKSGASKAPTKKVRLVLSVEDESRINILVEGLKQRGLKNYDLSDVVGEALETIEEDWWREKLEELTPLEWKIQAALENPEMREKLVSLLEG